MFAETFVTPLPQYAIIHFRTSTPYEVYVLYRWLLGGETSAANGRECNNKCGSFVCDNS